MGWTEKFQILRNGKGEIRFIPKFDTREGTKEFQYPDLYREKTPIIEETH